MLTKIRLLLIFIALLFIGSAAFGEARHSPNIYGIHFWDSTAGSIMSGKPGWTVENMQSNEWSWHTAQFQQIYNAGFTIICRLNYRAGYSVPGNNDETGRAIYAAECAEAVRNLSPYCHLWIIGNECNLPGEGNIDPAWYAKVYSGAADGNNCWDKIHAAQPNAVVLVAGIANWAPDFGYGDWKQYTRNIVNALDAKKVDAFSVHTYGNHYTWGTEVDPRYDGEAGFQSYRFIVPEIDRRFPDRPLYITETNSAADGPSPETNYSNHIQDWMQKAFQEINLWNSDPNNHTINCLCWFVYATGNWWDTYALESNVGMMPKARADYTWTTANTNYVNTAPGAGATRIQAEDYTGGAGAREGVDYHDTTSGNSGGQYRAQDVDIEACSEGGYNVGWTAAGEWLRYAFDGGGDYAVSVRYAAPSAGGMFHVEQDGVDVTGPIALPATGGWQQWGTAFGPTIKIPLGSHFLKLVIDAAGFNLNFLTLTPTGVNRLEAEDYTGGASAKEGVDYHDTTPGNAGGVYRTQNVDIYKRSDSGYYVGALASGEWLRYTFTATGSQWLTIHYSAWGAASCYFTVDGMTTRMVYLPSTGGTENWADFRFVVPDLSAGSHTLRFYVSSPNLNVDYFLLRPSEGGSDAPAAPTMLPATNVTSTTITWNWAPVPGVTGYRLQDPFDRDIAFTSGLSYTEACAPSTAYTRHVHAYNYASPLGPASNAVAQTTPAGVGAIAGLVTDAGGNPLLGASVTVSPDGLSATTTADGSYRFANLATGGHTVSAAKAGYSSRSHLTDVAVNATTAVNLSLGATPAITGLVNPGFETGDLTGWTPFGRCDEVHTGPWFGISPRSGSYFFGTAASYDHKDGGVFQRFSVTKGVSYTLSASIFTHNSGNPSDTQARLGVDPTGGTDPDSAAIQWTDWSDSQDAWKPISRTVTSEATAMTVFLRNWEKWNVQMNTNGWDDISVSPPAESFSTTGPFLRTGWNLVSLPAYPVDANPPVIFSGFDLSNSSLQYWDNLRTGGGWLVYNLDWDAPLDLGKCYWLLLSADPLDIRFSGYRNRADFSFAIPGRTAPFWIMFGQPFEHRTRCVDVMFSSPSHPTPLGWREAYFAGLVESMALGFDMARMGFFTAGPPDFMTERSVLEPWCGYWVLVCTPENLTVTIPVSPVAP